MVELRHLTAARSAPSRPDVDDHDLTNLITEALRVSVDVHGVKKRCGHVMQSHVSRLLLSEKAVPKRRCRKSKRESRDQEPYFCGQGKRPRTAGFNGKGNGCKKRNGHRDCR